MKVCMIGTGYVGLVSGTCFAEIGHDVVCVDNDQKKIDVLNGGGIPIYEPGLEDLVAKNVKAGRLSFTTDTRDGVDQPVCFHPIGVPLTHSALPLNFRSESEIVCIL